MGEMCERCKRMTAEIDMDTGKLVCYNPKCGQLETPPEKDDESKFRSELIKRYNQMRVMETRDPRRKSHIIG